MLDEFKKFALKGNMIDMAVGIIIGGAFGSIVTSLVNDIIMPPIGLLLGNVDFSQLKLALNSTVNLNYGVFINTLVNFLIVAFAIFIVVKQMNRFKSEPEATTKKCNECLSDIPIAAKRCAHCTSVV